MRRLLLLLPALCLGLAAPVSAQLAATSPFLPAGTAAVGPGGAAGGPIELRGEMSTAQGMQFCIYDTTKKVSTWVGVNEKGNEFVVRSHDAARDSVSVVYQGRTMNLTLKEGRVGSSGIAIAPVLNQMGAPGQLPPADDAQKIAAIAAEVARRRMLREQEIQRSTAPGAPPPAPIQLQPPARQGRPQ